jgi:ADP-ribose pyrophosphatase
MNYSILNREIIYQGRAFEVQKVFLQLPNQKKRYYDLIAHRDSVTIVPLDKDGNIWFVSQFRLGVEDQLLELPAGVLENGEDPKEGAMREIQEEIGMACPELKYLGDFYLAPGYSSEHMYIYLATDLYASALDPDSDEFLKVHKIAIPEALRMAENGEIKDSKTLASILLARRSFTIE